MNKSIIQHFGATLALTLLTSVAQDARPSLSSEPAPSPSPTATPAPAPEASAADESALAGDTSKLEADVLTNDRLLATPYSRVDKSNDAFTELEADRPFAAQPASPENGITLEQAIQTALEHNADILRQIAEIKRTRGQVIEVRAQALPRVGARSGYNQSKTLSGGNSSSDARPSSTPAVIGTVLVDGVALPVRSLATP
ncbi:MAG TPA: TolC family protein, partial [Chthoniobacterales bacterium]